jgi:tripartite ATP-independent transporter DctM subunit
MLVLSVALHFALYHSVFSGMRYEVRFVWSATLATLFALSVSLLNRQLQLGWISRLAEQVIIVLIPPLALIFLVLGTIFLGIATPTEGGAMGATGALILALSKRRINLKMLTNALISTAKLAAFIMFILIGARVFGLTFYGVNGAVWIEDLLLSLPGGIYGFLITVTIIVFILGCFLDFFEIAFIMVPLLVPVAETLGIDLIWFGVILGINLQTSFLTPPFGFSLFYLRSISPLKKWKDQATGKMMPAVKTLEIYKGALPFIVIQFAMIVTVIMFPGLVTHYKGTPTTYDEDSVVIELPPLGGAGLTLPSLDGDTGGLPGLTLPPLGGNGLPGSPGSDAGSLTLPGLSLDGPPVIGEEPAATPN